eukprot:262770-Hanusia_phi.AAC.1
MVWEQQARLLIPAFVFLRDANVQTKEQMMLNGVTKSSTSLHTQAVSCKVQENRAGQGKTATQQKKETNNHQDDQTVALGYENNAHGISSPSRRADESLS